MPWPYRAGLDCVVVAADETFVSSCFVWFVERNRAEILEPMGTHPDHRQRGLGSAVCFEALAARRAGATQAGVAARWDEAYPSARGLYASIGFEHTPRTSRIERPSTASAIARRRPR